MIRAPCAGYDEIASALSVCKTKVIGWLARRKDIYEALYPETRQGQYGYKGGKTVEKEINSVSTFAADTAEKTGVTERTIRQEIQIARDLVPEAKEAIRSADGKFYGQAERSHTFHEVKHSVLCFCSAQRLLTDAHSIAAGRIFAQWTQPVASRMRPLVMRGSRALSDA